MGYLNLANQLINQSYARLDNPDRDATSNYISREISKPLSSIGYDKKGVSYAGLKLDPVERMIDRLRYNPKEPKVQKSYDPVKELAKLFPNLAKNPLYN